MTLTHNQMRMQFWDRTGLLKVTVENIIRIFAEYGMMAYPEHDGYWSVTPTNGGRWYVRVDSKIIDGSMRFVIATTGTILYTEEACQNFYQHLANATRAVKTANGLVAIDKTLPDEFTYKHATDLAGRKWKAKRESEDRYRFNEEDHTETWVTTSEAAVRELLACGAWLMVKDSTESEVGQDGTDTI